MSSHEDSHGILKWVEKRIAAVTHIPVSNGEAFNVLEYQNLQHYDSHMDSFDPKVRLNIRMHITLVHTGVSTEPR